MLKVYEDKHYETPEVLQALKDCKIKVNRNAISLVYSSVIKIFEILLNQCNEALANKCELESRQIKRLYITSAKTYVSDMVLYAAM